MALQVMQVLEVVLSLANLPCKTDTTRGFRKYMNAPLLSLVPFLQVERRGGTP